MGFIKDGQQILRRMRFQGIVDQEMDQQFWGEVDNKRKKDFRKQNNVFCTTEIILLS